MKSLPFAVLSKYRYELIAVLNGAIIMVLEIVGARMIAPYFGSSIYVWTALIGVILAALSVGYWYGGKLADRGVSDRGLSVILLMSAGVLMASLLTRDVSLALVAEMTADLRLKAFVAALLLFAPANFLMGMVSPYLAKLKIVSLETAGSSIGALYAAGTAGSIIGTFAAGYWLVALMGNRLLGWWLVIGLLVVSAVACWRVAIWQRLALAVMAVLLMSVPEWGQVAASNEKVVYDGDSAYQRLQVVDIANGERMGRYLLTDNAGAQSGIFLDNLNEPAFGYIQRFLEVSEAAGAPKKVLLIGGGTYTLPHLLTSRYPEVTVDVVEIDSKLDELAQKYFGFRPDSRVKIIHEDGRTFLNDNRQKYDLIYMDAFSALTPPFQLTTTEAVKRLADGLTADGMVVVNMISAVTGPEAGFAEAEYATYRRNFEYVYVAPLAVDAPTDYSQNMIMIAGNDQNRVRAAAEKIGALRAEQPREGRVLTDDFAPVEQLSEAR